MGGQVRCPGIDHDVTSEKTRWREMPTHGETVTRHAITAICWESAPGAREKKRAVMSKTRQQMAPAPVLPFQMLF